MSNSKERLLRKHIAEGIADLCLQFSLEGDTPEETSNLHSKMQEAIYKSVAPLFLSDKVAVVTKEKKTLSRSKPSTGIPQKSLDKDKKSKVANHYATFHSQCSKNPKIKHNLPTMTYRFIQEPHTLGDKQQAIYMQIISDTDLCQAFSNFETTDIHAAITFIESKLKVDQMTRTAMLWSQFINEEDQKAYISWHKELTEISSNQSPKIADNINTQYLASEQDIVESDSEIAIPEAHVIVESDSEIAIPEAHVIVPEPHVIVPEAPAKIITVITTRVKSKQTKQ